MCLERGADLHMAQLMSLPLTVSCFSKIQIGLTFLVPAHPGMCVCVIKFLAMSLHSELNRLPRRALIGRFLGGCLATVECSQQSE